MGEDAIRKTYQFSSPESDFCGMSWPKVDQMDEYKVGKGLSFVSAESDFSAGFSMPEVVKSELEVEVEESINQTYSFSSAESDFAAMESPSIYKDEVLVPPSLSFASPESDWVGSVAAAYGALDMGLGVSRKHSPVYQDVRKKVSYNEAISAASSSSEPRVITEGVAPFRIVHANEAWKKVYEKNEGILGHTLAMANLKALGKDEIQ